MLSKILILTILSLFILGCAVGVPYTGELPEYIVLLTPRYPVISPRCTGVAISPTRIVTMQHCLGKDNYGNKLSRIATQAAQETTFRILREYAEQDLALLESTDELDLQTFGKFSAPDPVSLGTAFGACPHYFINVGRTVRYISPESTFIGGNEYKADKWRALDTNICGGDSGGIIIQNGKIVGMIHAIRSLPWFHIGKTVFTINGRNVHSWLSQEGKRSQTEYLIR